MAQKKGKCFVIMPFTAELDTVYDEAIARAVEEADYECIRADKIEGAGNIIRHIVESTDAAKIVIADLTNNNPNVLYELGLAHGLRKHVIMLTQNIDKIPFDLKNYRCVKYDMTFGAETRLRNAIVRELRALENNSGASTNPVHDFLPPILSREKYTELDQRNQQLEQEIVALRGENNFAKDIIAQFGGIDFQAIRRELQEQDTVTVNVPPSPDASQPSKRKRLVFAKVPTK